jgi:hypothetical protein
MKNKILACVLLIVFCLNVAMGGYPNPKPSDPKVPFPAPTPYPRRLA